MRRLALYGEAICECEREGSAVACPSSDVLRQLYVAPAVRVTATVGRLPAVGPARPGARRGSLRRRETGQAMDGEAPRAFVIEGRGMGEHDPREGRAVGEWRNRLPASRLNGDLGAELLVIEAV